MSITAVVENDTIKLPTHVPDGTRVEIVLPGESAAGGKSFYDAAHEFIGMFEGPRDLSTKPDPFDAMIGAFNGKAEATGRSASAGQSFYEAARESIGMFEGPHDLSTNPRHLDDFGK